MARRDGARGGARGGEGIPAARAARARVATSLAALGAAAALASWPALDAERFGALVAAAGSSAVLFLAVGLALRQSFGITLAIALLGVAYAVYLAADGLALDVRAAFYAAGLILVAETAFSSLEPWPVGAEPVVRKLVYLAVVAAASLLVAALVVAAATVDVSAGLLLRALGVAAAAGAMAIVAVLAARAR